MTYTAQVIDDDGDLEISEDGQIAGYLVFDKTSSISAQTMMNWINDMPFAKADLEVDSDLDEEGLYVRIYTGDRFVCEITGGNAETCIALGKALIKQIEGV